MEQNWLQQESLSTWSFSYDTCCTCLESLSMVWVWCWVTTIAWSWTLQFHPQFSRRNIMHVLIIEFVKQLLVALSTLYTSKVKQISWTCWVSPLPMMHFIPLWNHFYFVFPRLAEHRRVNPIFHVMVAFHLLSVTAVWMGCIFICFILWEQDCLFWRFVSLLCACGRGVLGMAEVYLGLEVCSWAAPTLTIYCQSISHRHLWSGSLACYLWEQSQSETVIAEWFMEMTYKRTNAPSTITPKLCSHMKSNYEQ